MLIWYIIFKSKTKIYLEQSINKSGIKIFTKVKRKQ